MPGRSVTETWGSRTTTTLRAWIAQKSIDQYFSGNLVLALLLGYQSDANREHFPLKAKRVIKKGGRKCSLPVRYTRSTNTTSFTRLDELPLNQDDIHTMADANWSYYTDVAVLSWQDFMENRGEHAFLNLAQERLDVAMDSIKYDIDTHIYSTGDGVSVGNGGKNIIGLDHFFSSDPTTGTVFGLNRATYSWWRHNLVTANDTFANTGIAKLANCWSTVSGTNFEDIITFWLTTGAMWEAFHARVSAIQEINTMKVGDMGFPTLEFMGRPIFKSDSVPSNVWWALNFNYITAVLQQGAQFAIKYQGAEYKRQAIEHIWRIFFGGQLAVERFDRQGRVLFTG